MSERSKRRSAAVLAHVEEFEVEKMVQAASIAARHAGDNDMAVVLKTTIESPTRATKIRSKLGIEPSSLVPYTSREALALVLNLSLTKQQYCKLHIDAKSRNADIYPSYNFVREAKKECRPADGIDISETSAKVSLQCLLDHTALRILQIVEEPLLQQIQCEILHMKLTCAWGFDGASGYSNYKQRFINNENDDSSLFVTSVIPLQLCGHNGHVYWINPAPQSPRFCRPLQIEFKKETEVMVREHNETVQMELMQLNSFKIQFGTLSVIVSYQMVQTLIDGKILNFLTGTKSMQTCPICEATPKQFNDLTNIGKGKFNPKLESLRYGVSPLHCWIRFFECCLHIGYRMEIKKWQVKGKENKLVVEERKKEVRKILRAKLGLIVDRPKPCGSGTTNDGNTSRRAFMNHIEFSKALGISSILVKRFYMILIAISCQLPLNVCIFDKFCTDTAKIFVEEYPWFCMPASVHKVLIHGAQIMKESCLPLGVLGEEGSEARNKYYKHDREFHSRKFSRKVTLEDILNRALDTSDPLISSMDISSRMSMKKKIPFPKEVLQMLHPSFTDSQTGQLSSMFSMEESDNSNSSNDTTNTDKTNISPYDFNDIPSDENS